MEGDRISIDAEGCRINDYIPAEEIFYETDSDESVELNVSAEEVFVLNDYRSDQNDGRRFGSIILSDLDGKVVFLFRWRGFWAD